MGRMAVGGFYYTRGVWSDASTYRRIIVDVRINETLQIGAVANSTYQTWGAKVSLYFLNSL